MWTPAAYLHMRGPAQGPTLDTDGTRGPWGVPLLCGLGVGGTVIILRLGRNVSRGVGVEKVEENRNRGVGVEKVEENINKHFTQICLI